MTVLTCFKAFFFFSLVAIIWEMNISGSGQPLHRLNKANHLVFFLCATEKLVALDLPFCCVCVGLGCGFLLTRQL